MPMVEISVGELVDKVTILALKTVRVKDPVKRDLAHAELKAILPIMHQFGITNRHELYGKLFDINAELWDIENEKRKHIRLGTTGTGEFELLSIQVALKNDKRAGIKWDINMATGSAVVEVKEHG